VQEEAFREQDKWKEGIPADTVARSHLKIERGLNDQSARAALSIFKENVQFAGLKAGIVQPEALESAPIEEPMDKPMPEVSIAPSPIATPSYFAAGPGAKTVATDTAQPSFQIVGNRVLISANLDLKGLRKLGKQLKLLETMLTMDDEENLEE